MNRVKTHEWKSGLAIRRIILGILWAGCLLFGVIGCYLGLSGAGANGDTSQMPTLIMGILFLLIAYWSRKEAYNSICLTYQCFPVLNRLLSVSQQENLLSDSEQFSQLETLGPVHRKFTRWNRMESRHWLQIKGYLISKELLIGMKLHNHVYRHSYRRSTYMEFVYANGEVFEIRLEDNLNRDEQKNYYRCFAKCYKTTSYLYDPKLLQSINKTYLEYVSRLGYASSEEALMDFVKDGSWLKEHIRTKYQHFWDKEDKKW